MSTEQVGSEPYPYTQNLGLYLSKIKTSCATTVCTFYGLEAKSAAQCNNPLPLIRGTEKTPNALIRAVKAAPVAGLTTGGQLIIKDNLLNALFDSPEEATFGQELSSGFATAFLTAPGAMALNGLSANLKLKDVFKLERNPFSQALSLSMRDGAFISGIGISKIVQKEMKERFGKSLQVEIGSQAVSGATGSLLGHIFDTALTRMQKGIPITKDSLLKGAPHRATTLAAFTVIYSQLLKLSKTEE